MSVPKSDCEDSAGEQVIHEARDTVKRFHTGLDYWLLVSQHGETSREVEGFVENNPDAESDCKFLLNALKRSHSS